VKALAYEKTLKKIQAENDVVAYSHRQGGWCVFEWNFNEDIKFHISSNFGYGYSSYLLSKFFYKGTQLTPYSKYVAYRYADYSELLRYTYTYEVNMSSWPKIIDDTLEFYHAVESNSEHEIFAWLSRELTQMVSGLNQLMDAKTEFLMCESEYSHSHYISGEDLVRVKIEKISGALDFIQNIRILPLEISPDVFVRDILNLVNRFEVYAMAQKKRYTRMISRLDKEILEINSKVDVSIYNRLNNRHFIQDQWYDASNKFRMIRYLLTLRDRLHLTLSNSEIRSHLDPLKMCIDQSYTLESQRRLKKTTLDAFKRALEKIKKYKANNSFD
jgi:hypothetical protein